MSASEKSNVAMKKNDKHINICLMVMILARDSRESVSKYSDAILLGAHQVREKKAACGDVMLAQSQTLHFQPRSEVCAS